MAPTRIPVVLAFFAIGAPSYASSTSHEPVEYVIAPGGKPTYYTMSNQGTNQIEARYNDNAPLQVLLTPHRSNDPKENLTGFSNMVLSPDGKTLFFETDS
jgi:hypothetical protein